jgi:hypothetical protein
MKFFGVQKLQFIYLRLNENQEQEDQKQDEVPTVSERGKYYFC